MCLGGEYRRILSLTQKRKLVFWFFVCLFVFFFKKDRRKHQSQGKRLLIFITLKLTLLTENPSMEEKASHKVTVYRTVRMSLSKQACDFFFSIPQEKKKTC